jgi:hypothetical protein
MTLKVSLETIQAQHTELMSMLESQPALEALAQNRSHLPLFQKLTSIFDNVSIYVKGALSGIETPKQPLILNELTAVLRKVSYLDLNNFPTPVVPGQAVGYKQYFATLVKCQNVIAKLYDYTFHPFEIFLASTINEPSKLESNLHSANVVEHDLSAIRKDLATLINPKFGETLSYTKVVSRHAEWDEIAKIASDLIVAQKSAPTELMVKTITNIDNLITKVIAGIEDTNQQYRPNPTVIKELANLCYSLAEHVTFYSVYMTQLNMGITALKRVQDILVTALKD